MEMSKDYAKSKKFLKIKNFVILIYNEYQQVISTVEARSWRF